MAIESAAPSQLDLIFSAMGDPTRRAILGRLALGEATVAELSQPFAFSQPTISRHLKVLEESGLVQSEKAGRVRTCRLAPQALSEAEHWIAERRQMWERNLDRLGAYLDQTKPENEK